jgi:glycolate oxidase iron-sulfur subunit
MAEIVELRRLMRQLEDQLAVCMHCGMCQAVCPVFAQTGREADVARGKLVLLDGLMQALLDDPEAVRGRLQRCLLCGSCAANCPSGVNVLEIFLKAHAILAGYLGLPPVKKAIFRRLLSLPRTMDRVVEFGAVFQRLFTQPVNEIVGTSCARFAAPLLAGRHFLTLAAVPFHRRHPSLDTPAGETGLTAGFFVGCLIDKIFPKVADAALRTLAHYGVGVFLPEGQGCCGIPAISSGDTKTFNDLVRYHLDLFDAADFDVLVTCCATCTSTIKKIWPALCAEELRARARALAARTMDIAQFLVRRVGPEAVATPPASGRIVTFHDSCHLKKSLGVFSEPRDLIRANPTYTLREMTAADDCCGMAVWGEASTWSTTASRPGSAG